MLRKAVPLLLLVLAAALFLGGCGDGVLERLSWRPNPVKLDQALEQVFGPVESVVEAEGGWVLLSPPQSGGRRLAFVSAVGGRLRLAGESQQVSAAGPVSLRREGELVVVASQREGAPQYAAFQVSPAGLKPVDYYISAAPQPAVTVGPFVLINKHMNILWHYEDGRLVKAYRVSTGKQTQPPAPTWQDYATNFFTPEGRFLLTNFVVHPPYNALKPGDKSYQGGAPGNPLGTRWMGFEVLPGDNAGIWGIHGTSEPDRIGTWASDGCIRMLTGQAEQLFGLLQGRAVVLQILAR